MGGGEGMSAAWDESIYPGRHSKGGNGAAKKRSLQFSQIDGKAPIPPRQWAYGRYLLFGEAAILAGIDGGGKGSMTVAIVLSFVTGRRLLGEKVWRPGPVVIISYEDSQDEWRRRIKAACIHYQLDYEECVSQIYFLNPAAADSGRISFGKLAEENEAFSDADEVIDAIQSVGAVLFIIDPFNQCHNMPDGNSNVMVAQVASEIARVCHETGAAGLALHHLRKSQTGAADDILGAVALRATFRSARVLCRMTTEEARAVQIPEKERFRYSRISDGKENYAPPMDRSTWVKLESIELGNGDNCTYPEGDNVQVTVRWEPPKPFEGMDYDVLSAIFDRIGEGPEGKPGLYSSAPNAKTRWVGLPVIEKAGKSKQVAGTIIKAWLDNGLLVGDDRRKTKTAIRYPEGSGSTQPK